MSEEVLNVYQKVAKVRKAAEVIQKNASGYGYKYVSEDEILAKISGVMDKYGLILIPSIVPGTFSAEPYTYTKTKITKGGERLVDDVNEIMVTSDMIFEWVNTDNPEERISVPWSMVGHQSDGSQGFGTALSYSYRYFLLKFLGIATPQDDADAWRSKQKESEAAEDKAIAEGIIAAFDELLRAYLADHQDKSDDVKSFVKRFVKNGNYNTISNPALASKLLEDFKNIFIKE